MENSELDNLAEKLYDYTCMWRKDNVSKDGKPGDPRKIGDVFSNLSEESKSHYRTMARFILEAKSIK